MCTYVRTHRGVCAGTLFPVCAPMCCNPGAYVHVCAVHGFHDFSSRPHGSYVQRRRGMCMRWGPLCAASCSEFGQGMCMYVRPAFCMCRLCLCVPTVGWKYHTTIHGRTRTYPCTYPSANNRTYPQEADLHIPPGVARKRRYRNECLVTKHAYQRDRATLPPGSTNRTLQDYPATQPGWPCPQGKPAKLHWQT